MESKYNFRELMKERHSCRKYQSKPIPEEVLKDIISISLMAPSWCNS
jgi:nitroreductase